jgi:hypothetical protein
LQRKYLGLTVSEFVKNKIKWVVALGGVFATLLLFGCSKFFELSDPPLDRAVVSDHWVERPGSPDYTLVEIDGHPVVKERNQFGVDMRPGAIALPGGHVFKVNVLPERRLPGTVPTEATFTDLVEGGKRYYVGTRSGVPVLVAWPKAKT